MKMVKAADAKPPQRFGRNLIKGSMLWQRFLEELKEVGPNQYLEFRGPKPSVLHWRRRIIKHIVATKLPLYTYAVSNDDDDSQTMYICGK